MKKIIDISMEIHEKMIVYPGNPRPKLKYYSKIPKDKTNEMLISLGSHTGTHVDSQKHIHVNGSSTIQLPLESLYGDCKVLDLTKSGSEISAKDLKKFDISKGDIILIKTENSLKQYDSFRKNFAHISYDAAKYIVKKEVKTLGIDYLSIKRFHADDEVHEILIDNLTLFEGLYLKKVKPGKYLFVGLPLKISCDGAPTRAILITK